LAWKLFKKFFSFCFNIAHPFIVLFCLSLSYFPCYCFCLMYLQICFMNSLIFSFFFFSCYFSLFCFFFLTYDLILKYFTSLVYSRDYVKPPKEIFLLLNFKFWFCSLLLMHFLKFMNKCWVIHLYVVGREEICFSFFLMLIYLPSVSLFFFSLIFSNWFMLSFCFKFWKSTHLYRHMSIHLLRGYIYILVLLQLIVFHNEIIWFIYTICAFFLFLFSFFSLFLFFLFNAFDFLSTDISITFYNVSKTLQKQKPKKKKKERKKTRRLYLLS